VVLSTVAPASKRKASLHTITKDMTPNCCFNIQNTFGGRKAITPSILFDLKRSAASKGAFSKKAKHIKELLTDAFYKAEDKYYNSKTYSQVNPIGNAFAG
jgi:hypothetical protein